jgi:putative endonuclease
MPPPVVQKSPRPEPRRRRESKDKERERTMGAWVYMLRCADGAYYVGSTRTSLEERIGKHNAGHFGGYTSKRRPVTLVFSDYFDRITDAIAAERQLKGWRRAKKEALIRGDFDLLRELAWGFDKT